jgi:RNA polymerase sigma-70 factor (ECF subfamily)
LSNIYNHINNHIQSFQKGEEKGFKFFFEQLYPGLCVFAQRYVPDIAIAEDIVSESFVKVWDKHEGFTNATALRSYLYRTVYHGCLRWLEKEKKRMIEVEDKADGEIEEVNYLSNIIRSETIRELYTAMNTLPKECKKVFDLLYVEGKSVKEAAETLAVSVSTVKAQKARGLQLLRLKINLVFVLFLAVI